MTQEELKQRLIKLLMQKGFGVEGATIAAEYLIANNVTIRERGEWKDNHCTVCGMTPIGEETWTNHDITPPKFEWFMDFCPHCGADLRGEKTHGEVIPDKGVESRQNIKFETGDNAKIAANVSEHDFEIGTIVRLEKCDTDYKAFVGEEFWWVVDDELELIEDADMRG